MRLMTGHVVILSEACIPVVGHTYRTLLQALGNPMFVPPRIDIGNGEEIARALEPFCLLCLAIVVIGATWKVPESFPESTTALAIVIVYLERLNGFISKFTSNARR